MDFGKFHEMSIKIGKDRKLYKNRMPSGKYRVVSFSGRHYDDRWRKPPGIFRKASETFFKGVSSVTPQNGLKWPHFLWKINFQKRWLFAPVEIKNDLKFEILAFLNFSINFGIVKNKVKKCIFCYFPYFSCYFPALTWELGLATAVDDLDIFLRGRTNNIKCKYYDRRRLWPTWKINV